MSGKMSRDKGANFERMLAGIFRDKYGYDAERTAQHCGKNGDAPDVRGLRGIHIEAKAVEKLNIQNAMKQAIDDSAGTGNIPVVIHKKNYKGILVTMRLDDFMQLYREWEAHLD